MKGRKTRFGGPAGRFSHEWAMSVRAGQTQPGPTKLPTGEQAACVQSVTAHARPDGNARKLCRMTPWQRWLGSYAAKRRFSCSARHVIDGCLPELCLTSFSRAWCFLPAPKIPYFGRRYWLLVEFLLMNFNLQQARLSPLSEESTPNPPLGAVFTTWYHAEHQQGVSECEKGCAGCYYIKRQTYHQREAVEEKRPRNGIRPFSQGLQGPFQQKFSTPAGCLSSVQF